MSPPDSIGTRNGSAAAAASASELGPAMDRDGAEREDEQPGARGPEREQRAVAQRLQLRRRPDVRDEQHRHEHERREHRRRPRAVRAREQRARRRAAPRRRRPPSGRSPRASRPRRSRAHQQRPHALEEAGQLGVGAQARGEVRQAGPDDDALAQPRRDDDLALARPASPRRRRPRASRRGRRPSARRRRCPENWPSVPAKSWMSSTTFVERRRRVGALDRAQRARRRGRARSAASGRSPGRAASARRCGAATACRPRAASRRRGRSRAASARRGVEPARVAGEDDAAVAGERRALLARERDVRRQVVAVALAVELGEQQRLLRRAAAPAGRS